MIVIPFSPCFYIKDPRSFSYKLDMGSNSYMISSPLIQTDDKGNSELNYEWPLKVKKKLCLYLAG